MGRTRRWSCRRSGTTSTSCEREVEVDASLAVRLARRHRLTRVNGSSVVRGACESSTAWIFVLPEFFVLPTGGPRLCRVALAVGASLFPQGWPCTSWSWLLGNSGSG